MTRAEGIRELQSLYQQQRARNESELQARIDEAERLDPEIARLREDNRALAFDTLKKLMASDDEQERTRLATQMKQCGIENNRRLRERLKLAGLSEDHIKLQFRCAICRDTGLVGDAPARFCDCFETRLKRLLFESDGEGERRQSFESFDIDIFPEEDGQRAQMRAVRRACEDYADSFPGTRVPNLLLMGNGGLGKSFLLNCIYERALSRGHAAVRISAFRMFEAMRRKHFANSAEDMEEFDRLLGSPLLLIDDLGSEPMLRNISVEYLFTLLSERRAAQRQCVIATNLSPTQLRETYGERVASRLLDKRGCAAIMLRGKDLRLL